jgi:NADH:ubiquinone oxidoreductase subunit 2 (subunit N)
VALTGGAFITVVLGIFPQPVLDLAEKAANLVG